MKYKQHTYQNYHGAEKSIKEAILSSSDCIFAPHKIMIKNFNHQKIGSLWNEKEFEKINLPQIIERLSEDEKKIFSIPQDCRILDLPIKMKDNLEFRLPLEIIELKSMIQKIANHAYSMNKNFNDYYCYLTIDKKEVLPNQTGRKAGIHVDGFQGAPLPIDHSYIIYDNNPTLFYKQPFSVKNWDRSCHNYFQGFEKQKRIENIIKYPNYEILFIDAYCLHESAIIINETRRTFFRMSFSVREFDRLGNAHNPMFDYNWNMQPRDTQSTLVCPVSAS